MCKACTEILIEKTNRYKIECDEFSEFETADHFELEYEYLNKVNRGRLLKPSLPLYSVVKLCLCFFERHIRPLIGIKIKNPSSNQLRDILHKFLNSIELECDFKSCSDCKIVDLLYEIVRILSNIILNNFCKITTDEERKYIKDVTCGSVKKIKDQKKINITGKR